MWVSGRVEIIEKHLDRFIGTVKGAFLMHTSLRGLSIVTDELDSGTMAMPSIVRHVGRHVRKRYRMRVKYSKSNVYLRDHGRCQYCNVYVERGKATYDHVVPRSQGGKTVWKNMVIACWSCNQHKGARTPEQADMRLRTKPIRPRSLPGVSNEVPFQPGMPPGWEPYLA